MEQKPTADKDKKEKIDKDALKLIKKAKDKSLKTSEIVKK